MDDNRKVEIFHNAIDRLMETAKNRALAYNTLRLWGMSDDEIKEIPSMTEFIDDGSKESLSISAFIKYDHNGLTIPLPSNAMTLFNKLSSIGIEADNLLMYDYKYDSSVELMTVSSTGCHFIRLFSSQDSLLDVSNTLIKVINSPDEIWPTLRERLVNGCYTSYKDLLDDVELLITSIGKYTTSFYFPLYGELYDPDSCQSDYVSDRYLRNFKSEIEMLLETEQQSDDMTKYFSECDSKSAHEKIVSIKWGITEFVPGEYNSALRSRTIFGVVQIRHSAPFTDEEKSSIKDWIEGQNADGFGEGIEQREIDTEDGDLYVQLWRSDDDYFIYDEAQMKEYIKYGGLLT